MVFDWKIPWKLFSRVISNHQIALHWYLIVSNLSVKCYVRFELCFLWYQSPLSPLSRYERTKFRNRNRKENIFDLGISWDSETRLFPKTTLCDFTVREFGHPRLAHEYTVPCVLPLNLFNQQMFTVLYFWYVLVILMNIGDFFLWLYIVSPRHRREFIRKRLHSKKYPLTNDTANREKMRIFTDEYLGGDGFFMLTLIKENSSDFVTSEIVYRLYTEKFLKRHALEPTAATIYDAIDPKQADDESISDIKRRHHLCSLIC